MLSLFRLFVHTAMLSMAWELPLSTADCGPYQALQGPQTLVFAVYTMWIGFELGTTIMEKTVRKDMLIHHIFTVFAVLVAWQQSITCVGYAIVRSTLLCEPFVDLYFIFKNTRAHVVTDILLFLSFPYTRLVLMFQTVTYPLMFKDAIDASNRSQFMGAVVVMFIYGMQWMWAYKIVKGGIEKLNKK
jgi:hypothetical protein